MQCNTTTNLTGLWNSFIHDLKYNFFYILLKPLNKATQSLKFQ